MALSLLAANNAQTVLAAGISSTATSLTVNAGTGTLFPSPVAGTSFFKLTIIDAATGSLTEIVHVTARNGDVFTIQRGQEGTVPRSWSANDIVANMMTAGTLSYILGSFQPLDPTLTALAALVGVANKLPYFNGDDTAALTDLTQVGRDIIGKTDIAAVLQYLGLANAVIGDSVKRIGFSTNDVKKPYFRFPDTDTVILLATQQAVSTALNNKQDADDTLTELSGKNVAGLIQYLGLANAVIGDGTKNAGFSGGDATKPYMRHTQSDSVIFLATTSQLIGIGQAYRVVTDKVLGVTYTNTSKQPWVVSLKVNLPASAEVLIKVDGVMAGGGNAANNAGTSVWAYPSAIIPPGSTYVVTAPGGTLIQWVELK
ncbi:hypothetical protein ABLC58_12330 [Escherichia coli]|uniref:hypothetical protein n=1 Tax=Escherichia coli TaxID=562 RepID=UPI0036DEC6ED